MGDVVILSYSRRPTRRRSWRFVLFLVLLLAGLLAYEYGARWKVAVTQWYWHRRLTHHAMPPDAVILELDARAAESLVSRRDYRPIATSDGSASGAGYVLPAQLQQIVDGNTSIPGVSGPAGQPQGGVTAFLATRTTASGVTRLVQVRFTLPQFPLKPNPRGYVFAVYAAAHDPSMGYARDDFGDDPRQTLLYPVWPGVRHRTLRIFAGQPDVADASHFTIEFESDGRRGTLHGWLKDVQGDSRPLLTFQFSGTLADPARGISETADVLPLSEAGISPALDGRFVVHAKAIGFGRTAGDGWLFCAMQIDHVYSGPRELMGKHFIVQELERPWDEESGIWQLRIRDRGGELETWPGTLGAARLPQRELAGSPYSRLKAVAEAMEVYSGTPPDRRLRLVCNQLDSLRPDVLFWAAVVVENEFTPAAVGIFDRLIDRSSLSAVQAFAADLAMSELRDDDWKNDPRRPLVLHLLSRSHPTPTERELISDWMKEGWSDDPLKQAVAEALR